jgi:hypothetical protein
MAWTSEAELVDWAFDHLRDLGIAHLPAASVASGEDRPGPRPTGATRS